MFLSAGQLSKCLHSTKQPNPVKWRHLLKKNLSTSGFSFGNLDSLGSLRHLGASPKKSLNDMDKDSLHYSYMSQQP